jgi:hypothetical protein
VLNYLSTMPWRYMRECIALNFLDLGIKWRWAVSFTPQGKRPRYPLDRRLGGPQSRSGRCGEEKNLELLRIEPGSSSPRIFWDVTPYISVGIYRYFWVIYWLPLQDAIVNRAWKKHLLIQEGRDRLWNAGRQKSSRTQVFHHVSWIYQQYCSYA